MVTRKSRKNAASAAATFGVAMAAVYIAPEINADVLDITWNGGDATASKAFDTGTETFPTPQDIDQIPNGVVTTVLGSIYNALDVVQFNDQMGGTGRSMVLFVTETTAGTPFIGGPQSLLAVNEGDVIDPATFAGATADGQPGPIGLSTFDGSGSAFVAGRPRVAPDNVFWFKLEYTVAGPIVYSTGQYGDAGETLTVGGGMQDCDNALGDVNGDGVVDLLDVDPFVDGLVAGEFVCEADVNEDGAVDLLDVDPFVQLLLGG